MQTTQMSSRGQVVIPKKVRDTFGWAEGTQLTIELHEGGVLIVPALKKKRPISHLFGSLPKSKKKLSLDALCAPVVDYEKRI